MFCPNCGASISVTSDGTREFCFCEYCGSKVKIIEPNTSTVRYVDEAIIREAELNAQIRLKELELQSSEQAQYEKRVAGNRKFFRKRLLIYIIAGFGAMLLAGLLSSSVSWNILTPLIVIGSISICCAVYGSLGHGIAMLLKRRR